MTGAARRRLRLKPGLAPVTRALAQEVAAVAEAAAAPDTLPSPGLPFHPDTSGSPERAAGVAVAVAVAAAVVP
jgi:hypothetical protein